MLGVEQNHGPVRQTWTITIYLSYVTCNFCRRHIFCFPQMPLSMGLDTSWLQNKRGIKDMNFHSLRIWYYTEVHGFLILDKSPCTCNLLIIAEQICYNLLIIAQQILLLTFFKKRRKLIDFS